MCMKCLPEIDMAKADAFAEKMMESLANGSLLLMTSLGHRTGLFDSMSDAAPASCEEIAERSGLNERYVREWLSAMACGGIVTYEPESRRFTLPAEHAQWLTRAGSSPNLAVPSQWMAVLGSAEDRLVECFQQGGGASYSDYHRFHDVMAEESYQSVVKPLLEHILPLADGLEARLMAGIDVADIGCGEGKALMQMAESFPQSRYVGYDYCAETVAMATAEAQRRGLRNVRFEQLDVSKLEVEAAYDCIFTFDAIHDQGQPAAVLANIHRALRPNGIYLMQDIAGSSKLEANLENPLAAFLYSISCMHCMSVSLGQGGVGLGAMWGRELATEMIRTAGFHRIEVLELEHDPMNYYYIMRK